MPKAYEKMRDKFAAEGMDYDAAQGKAARIYNSNNPGNPVGATTEARGKPSGTSRKKKGLQAMVKRSKSMTGYILLFLLLGVGSVDACAFDCALAQKQLAASTKGLSKVQLQKRRTLQREFRAHCGELL